MAYATNAQLISRVGGSTAAAQLTSDSGSTPDQDVLTEVREAAEAEINRYLSKRQSVPVDVSGSDALAASLRELTLDVAEYRLHLRRKPVSEDTRSMYQRAIEFLQAYAKGDAGLPGDSSGAGAYDFVRDDAGAEDMV